MTHKKKSHQDSNESNEGSAEAVTAGPQEAAPQAVTGLATELQALTQRLEEAEARAAEHLDGWQRTQADFQNYRKRTERDSESTYLSMKADIIRHVLPVLDDLERALQNRPANSDAWVGGIELIHRKLQSILEAEGVKTIVAEGQPFDPTFHEAISHEPAEGVESGNVIAVTQNGYLLGERVIRPALVRVAQ
jgi:molecular chaperone GrpE